MYHIISSCSQTKLEGGLPQFTWLTAAYRYSDNRCSDSRA